MDSPEQTSQTSQTTESTLPEINEELIRRRMRQSLPAGIAAGSVAALVGAVLWAAITYATNMQIGWMAVGVGFLVGYAVRFGRGIDPIFKVCGATLALLGCLLGNVLTIYAYAAKSMDTNVFDAMSRLDFGTIFSIMGGTFSPIDLLFYGIAVYEGWRFATLPEVAQVAEE